MSAPQSGADPVLVVRYRWGFGVIGLVAGLVLLVLGTLTGSQLDIVMGVVLAAAGTAFLRGRALVLTGGELQLRSLIGLTTRRFPVRGPQDLRLDGRTLRHAPGDHRVMALGMSLNPRDVERLRAWVTGEETGPAT